MYLHIEYIEFIATSYNLSSANPQTGQKLSKTLSATADEAFECVLQFG